MTETTAAPCPVCRQARTHALFQIPDATVWRCGACDFLFLYPQPSDEVLRRIYSADYFLGATDERMRAQVAALKTATAELYLDRLASEGISSGRLLEVGCGDGYFLHAAEKRGYEVVGVEYSEHAAQRARSKLVRGEVRVGELAQAGLPREAFDVCILSDVIEHVRDPRGFLLSVRDCLKPGGVVLIATPSTDSWSARLMRRRWMEFKTEHMSYFNRRTLESLLVQTDFENVRFFSGYKMISLHYVQAHFESYSIPLWTSLVRLTGNCLSRGARESPAASSAAGC